MGAAPELLLAAQDTLFAALVRRSMACCYLRFILTELVCCDYFKWKAAISSGLHTLHGKSDGLLMPLGLVDGNVSDLIELINLLLQRCGPDFRRDD